jgi:polyhydroxybutyrate depolymerase
MSRYRIEGAAAFALAMLLMAGAAGAADIERTIPVGGLDRHYALHLPPGANDRRPMALVVVLHGGAGNGRSAAAQTKFSAEADRSGFIVAYPDGTDQARPLLNALGKPGLLTWNAGGCCGYAREHRIDDVGFLRAMIGEIARSAAVDPKRVFAAGLSNGAMMAYRLACEASDVIAAVGIVSGVVVSKPCAPREPVSVIHIHGSADENVPLAGGIGRKALTRTNYPPVADSIALWAGLDGCQKDPVVTEPAPHLHLSDFHACRGGTEVAYYVIGGGGHSWPGGERMLAMLDPPSQAMMATETIWRFFAAHPKP